jgi:hypothetical protein
MGSNGQPIKETAAGVSSGTTAASAVHQQMVSSKRYTPYWRRAPWWPCYLYIHIGYIRFPHFTSPHSFMRAAA